MIDYANLIKKLRTKLILSQTEFFELLGTTFGTVNRWESGKHEPTIKMNRKIVELCQKTMSVLRRMNNYDNWKFKK